MCVCLLGIWTFWLVPASTIPPLFWNKSFALLSCSLGRGFFLLLLPAAPLRASCTSTRLMHTQSCTLQAGRFCCSSDRPSLPSPYQATLSACALVSCRWQRRETDSPSPMPEKAHADRLQVRPTRHVLHEKGRAGMTRKETSVIPPSLHSRTWSRRSWHHHGQRGSFLSGGAPAWAPPCPKHGVPMTSR